MNSVYKERFKHNHSVYNKAAVAIVINCFKKLFYNIHVCMVTDLPTADCDIRPDPGCDMGVAIPTGGGGAGAGGGAMEGAII